MNRGYLWLVFVLIVVYLLLQPNSNAKQVINALSKEQVNTIMALQGRLGR